MLKIDYVGPHPIEELNKNLVEKRVIVTETKCLCTGHVIHHPHNPEPIHEIFVYRELLSRLTSAGQDRHLMTTSAQSLREIKCYQFHTRPFSGGESVHDLQDAHPGFTSA